MTAPTQSLSLATIRAVMFDMDGVVYRGAQALPGVNEILTFLLEHDIGYACITNNASRTPQQFADSLHAMDISVPAERIITSSIATSVWLRAQVPRGTTVYAVGMDGLRSALFDDGYFVEQHQNPEYVVVGADFEMTYAKLKTACLAIRAGSKFIGTNPDTTFPSEEGIIPGVGAFILALEAATAQEATIIGKPERAMFDAALQLLGASPDAALVVGDRLDTDILGANRASVRSALVLTGVSTEEELAGSDTQPDAVYADLPALLVAWRQALGAGE